MALRWLDRLWTTDWSALQVSLDLACETVRVGACLMPRGGAALDGIDLTPEMLTVPRGKDMCRTRCGKSSEPS